MPVIASNSSHTEPAHVAQLKGLLKLKHVIVATGLSKSSVYALLKDKKFPEPVRLGARCTRWRMADIQAWIDQVGR